jgi:hypothetical protein
MFDDDDDRDSFADRVGDFMPGTSTGCYGWAPVDNHAHLLLRTGDVPIAAVMRRLLMSYAVTYNRRHRRYCLEAQGYGIEKVIDRVAELFGMEAGEVARPGKQPLRGDRAPACYWTVRELGMTPTAVGKRLGLTQPAVRKAVWRGGAHGNLHNLRGRRCVLSGHRAILSQYAHRPRPVSWNPFRPWRDVWYVSGECAHPQVPFTLKEIDPCWNRLANGFLFWTGF